MNPRDELTKLFPFCLPRVTRPIPPVSAVAELSTVTWPLSGCWK